MNSIRSLATILALALLAALALPAFAAPPVVSNVRAAQRPGTHLVDILYNVTDPDGATPMTISVAISDNGGTTYNVPVFTLSGAVGAGVLPGNDRLITWNAGQDWPGRFNNQCRVRILADDGSAPPAPVNMAYIPGGVFQMGDNFGENTSAMPVHSIYISPFFMDKFEVSRELWLDVQTWSQGNGYESVGGSFKAAEHPVHAMHWYSAVKWCNARSEKEGLTPCYYTDASQTTVYRTGTLDITNACVKWNANGYRLPTEANGKRGRAVPSPGIAFLGGIRSLTLLPTITCKVVEARPTTSAQLSTTTRSIMTELPHSRVSWDLLWRMATASTTCQETSWIGAGIGWMLHSMEKWRQTPTIRVVLL